MISAVDNNNGQQCATMDNNGQQRTTANTDGQQLITMDNNGQQSAVLHASLMPFFHLSVASPGRNVQFEI